MNIAIQLLLSTLIGASPASTEVPDLCDVVHRETGTPTICKPHEVGAPIYDWDVCCAGSSCFGAAGDGCLDSEVRYYCELGVAGPTGEVSCFFEVPDYCDVHPCEKAVAPYPWKAEICCQWDYCFEITPYSELCHVDDIYSCASLVSNEDGTVTCVDDE